MTYPHNFGVEPTIGCNLRCPICAVGCGKMTRRSPRFLTAEKYETIADRIQPHAKLVMLYNQGEPCLNPWICDIIERTQEFAAVLMHTNGNTRVDIKRLAATDAHICVCIDGLSQKVYEVYRRGGHVGTALSTLILLAQERRRHRSKAVTEAQYLLFEHNQHELLAFLRVMEALEVPVRVKIPQTALNPVLQETTYDNFQKRVPATVESIRGCELVKSDMVINADGTVVSCCYDYNADNALGNVFEESVEEIWDGKHRAFRESVAADPPPKFCLDNCLSSPTTFVYSLELKPETHLAVPHLTVPT